MRRGLIRGRCGTALACAGSLVVGLLLAAPAGAQWIGAAGGDGSPPAKPPTAPLTPPPSAMPAPAAAAPPPAAAAAASPAFGATFESPGMAMPGMSSPALSSPGLSSPEGFGGELPNGGLAGPGGPAGPRSGPGADCQKNVMSLRADVEKNGEVLKTAAKKKRPPDEICPMFRNFVASQSKFYDYLAKNKSNCGVPDNVLKSLKSNISGMSKTRDKVCEVAANGGIPPGAAPAAPQGMLSQGLGLPTGLPSVTSDRPGGVYDTLGGNALR